MKNLILTPSFKNFEVLKECCDAIDKYSTMPFLHVIIDDNSGKEVPIEVTENRRVIQVKSDIPGLEHKNQLGQMLDLGFAYGTQKFWNEKEQEPITGLFIIESDVVVKEDWDIKMLETFASTPDNCATFDATSVNEEGSVTYPDTVAPRHESKVEGFDSLHYPMFQCTLMSLDWFRLTGIRFSDFASHFDILTGRAIESSSKCVFLRTRDIEVLHINGGGSSRGML